MKRKIFFVVLAAVLCSVACDSRGELITPPDGLEQAAKDFLAAKKQNFKLLGLSVRQYPNDVFLISADTEYTKEIPTNRPATTNDTPTTTPEAVNTIKKMNVRLIAEKGYRDGETYWQVTEASAGRLKLLGIKPE